MQKILISSLMLAGVSSTLTVQAANEDAINLPDTVVTATRSDTARTELATAATVFTREDIEQSQARTLPDLLKGSTGIDVAQSGGYGQPASVIMRGTNASHVLVLIDGIKVGSVTLGTTAFELIPIEQIERVEITRGPQSSLYGSEAIGGVIQIFTRKGKDSEKPSVAVEAGGGSYATHREAGNISGRWQNSWYNLGVSNLESNGFAPRVKAPAGVINQGAYNNTALNARVGHRFDNSAEVEAFFMRSEGANQFTKSYGDDIGNKQFINQVLGTSLTMDVMSNWRSVLRFGQSQDESHNLGSTIAANNTFFNTTRWNATWLNDIMLADKHKLTLGTDYRVDEVDSSEKFTKTSRYDVGVFGELHSEVFKNNFMNASLRWDKNQAFGDYVTGNIGWRFNWNYGLSAFANFGNAFKAPSFNDLYYPLDSFGSFGNPNLKPESSKSVEAGLRGEHGKLNWEFRAYHTDIDNLISWQPVDPNDVFGAWSPANVSKAQIDGLEAEIDTQFLGWTHKLNGNLLSPRDRENSSKLIGRADKTLSYDVSRSFGAFDVGGKVLAQSDRLASNSGTVVNGFVTLDFRTAYHIDKNWMISGKLNNVLDKNYQTVSNYNMADRNFFISIHYNN